MINSLYVHIPFCIKKCLYCDFNSYSNMWSYEDKYIDALLKEADKIEEKSFNTIFVGGGTPTTLSLYNLERLLKKLSKYSPKEFTFEGNPGTIDIEKLKLLKYYGVNRLSIGLQAWQNNLLKSLGRIHDLDSFLKTYNEAIKVGFDNINIDLMFAIPDQSMDDWVCTLKNVVKLNPQHLSCYSLIIEEGTPFFKLYNENKLKLVDEDTDREMYYFTKDYLSKNGFKQYEISNFAKHNKECKHNITYWMDEEYIGIGAGAHSYSKGYRYNNYPNVPEYIDATQKGNAIQNKVKVTVKDELEEFMFMGLRMTDGILKKRFKDRFKKDIYDVYGSELCELKKLGLLIEDNNYIKLSNYGVDVSNKVFEYFIK
ncbi:MAG TPA: oxygen-independent coproporphyrinogen III oxidase [Clostridiaceae bacterium]|nr:oxygen-independent coproporphyrinogen III oxidase [Clostridiaceae bacterium]